MTDPYLQGPITGAPDGGAQAPGGEGGPTLDVSVSDGFGPWLEAARAAVAFTTYQASKLFLVGLSREREITVFERTFGRCMGLGASRDELWLATGFQLYRFENFLSPGQIHEGFDAVYVPLQAHTTGEADIHDVHGSAIGAPVFVATRFNCLATLDRRHSFIPLWKPPFISDIVAEDRCHLNGLAMRDGKPAYVTLIAATDVAGGWRDRRRDGGMLWDLRRGGPLVEGLSMPHSPRLYDGRLWMLNSGAGEFGWVDEAAGRFVPVAFLPGFARGMTFVGRHAVIGVSKPRREGAFQGLALNERLADAGREPLCAICVVNLDTGEVEHEMRLEGYVQELYDTVAIPGVRRPMALGFQTDEIRYFVRPGPIPQRRPKQAAPMGAEA